MTSLGGRKRPAQSNEDEFGPSPQKMKKEQGRERVADAVRNRLYQGRPTAAQTGREARGLCIPVTDSDLERRPFIAQEGGVIHLSDDIAQQNGPVLTDIDVSMAKRRSRNIDIWREKQIMNIGRIAATFVKSCKTCLDRKKIWCQNLPCGHMTNCYDCAPLMLKCAHCAQDIRGTSPIQDIVWKCLVDSTDSGMFLENSY